MNAHLAERLLEYDRDNLSETAKRHIELIARSSLESTALVTDLLNFARLGQEELVVRQVDPTAIVRSLRSEFEESNPGIRWTVNPLPQCEGDPGLLKIVFTNLLNNACKFTAAEPEPSIEVGVVDFDASRAYYVRDNGVGFDMAQSDRMFDVFERLHRPEDYPGTGAGLAIVRRIVEKHGGRVWAESEIDQGATFFFTVPSDA